MAMIFKPDWLYLLKKSWSIKWQAAAGLLDASQIILPMFTDKFQPGPFAGLIFLICIGGIVARVMGQPKDGI